MTGRDEKKTAALLRREDRASGDRGPVRTHRGHNLDTVGDRAPIEKSSEQRLTARKRTGIEPAGRSLSRGPIGFEDRAGHQPRKRLRWRHYPEAPWCCDLLGEPAQTVLVASVSSPKAQAFAQAARGLAGDLDGVAARGARSVADHLGWLEANDVGEVDQGAAVDTREAVAAEADLQLLQRQGAQVLRVAGVDGDSSPSRSAWVTSRGSSSTTAWRETSTAWPPVVRAV